MDWHFSQRACFALVSSLALLQSSASGGEGSLTDVLGQLRKHDARFQSLKIDWTEEVELPRGYLSDPSMNAGGSEVVPPVKQLISGSCQTVVTARKLKLVREDEIWSLREKGPVPHKLILTRDAVHEVRFHEYSDAEEPDATIRSVHYESRDRNLLLRPLSLYVGWLADALSPFYVQKHEDDLSLAWVTFGSRRMPVLTHASHRRTTSIWLDPMQGYSVRRIISHQGGGRGEIQFDIDYRESPTDGWLPSGWKYSSESQRIGAPETTTTATVTRIVVNPSLGAVDLNQTKFPIGTWVFHEGTREGWVVQ